MSRSVRLISYKRELHTHTHTRTATPWRRSLRDLKKKKKKRPWLRLRRAVLLGFRAVLPQPLPTKATAGKPAATSTRTSTADAPSAAPSKKNSRRKRSAAHSARHHTLRQQQLTNRCIMAMLFVARLRRRVRKRVLLQDLADLDELNCSESRLRLDADGGAAVAAAGGASPSEAQ